MFTQEQINKLLENENVSKCTSKSITYKNEFKLMAINEYYKNGHSPNMIFKKAGFDLNIIGKHRPKECLQNWRRVHKKNGEKEFKKENRGGSGRRKKLEFKTKEEEIEYLKTKIAYIEAENDFLAKLRGLKKE